MSLSWLTGNTAEHAQLFKAWRQPFDETWILRRS